MGSKTTKLSRCSNCNKALRNNNQSGFCSACYLRERPWKDKSPTKTKKIARKAPMEEYVCAECGQEVGVIKGSICKHCGQTMDPKKKWRRKYE